MDHFGRPETDLIGRSLTKSAIPAMGYIGRFLMRSFVT